MASVLRRVAAIRPNFNKLRPAYNHFRQQTRKASDGISHDIQYSGFWQQIMTFPKRKPYATNIMIATIKTGLADYVVQMYVQKNEVFDYKRNAVFIAFGCLYLGVFQWFVYVTCFAKLCPNAIKFSNMSWAEKRAFRPGQIDLAKQVFIDNFIHYTFIYFPVFYVFKEAIQGEEGVERSGVDIIKAGMSKYAKNFWPDNYAIWGLWIPADFIIYAVPIWMRLPLNHSLSLLWTMILSYLRGDEIKEEEVEETKKIEGQKQVQLSH